MSAGFIYPEKVSGWLTKKEGKLLYELAKKNKKLGVLVELGSYHGKSTICLAQASRDTKGGRVYALDNFIGDKYTGISDSFLNKFKSNIAKYSLSQWVEPIKGEFSQIAKNWKLPIRFIFIDGSHSYTDVRKDYEAWSSKVVNGGIIAFHDALSWPGVVLFINELIKSGDYGFFDILEDSAGIAYIIKSERKASSVQVSKNLEMYTSLVGKRKLLLFFQGLKEKFKIGATSYQFLRLHSTRY